MREAAPKEPGWMSLSDGTRVRIGRSMIAAAVVATGVAIVFIAALGRWSFLVENGVVLGAVFAVGFGSLAWIMLAVQPRNGVVWTYTWASWFGAVGIVGSAFQSYVARGLDEVTDIIKWAPADLSLGLAIGVWPAWWGWAPGIFLPVTLGVLLFPDGRLPSPRWRWVAWASLGSIALIMVAFLWEMNPTSTVKYDFGEAEDDGTWVSIAFGLGFFTGILCCFACLGALIARYRHSDLDTRRQIRIVVFGFVAFAIGGTGSVIVDIVTGGGFGEADTPLLDRALFFTGQVILVASFAVAILKFRLYDLDVVVSKTFTSLVLAAFISTTYIGLVVGTGELLGGRSSFLLSIVVATVIAMVFQPARRAVQAAANRLVYGNRSSPYEVLAQFGRRATELSDDELISRVPRLVVDGTSAARATLWLESGGGFDKGPSWPDTAGSDEAIPVADNGSVAFVDAEADRSLPIRHDGELLGGISIVASRGERVTAADDHVLSSLASALGLALRNARLTTRLRSRLAHLEASRERILAATDDARRSLEAELDRGPQQLLAGVETGLGEANELISASGGEKMTAMLTGLEQDAANARAAVRSFARGIYPPLLESEGLAAALTEQTEAAALPITVTDEGIGRYPAEVESAVYFTLLEAVQNTTKHANATAAHLTLGAQGDKLSFELIDDGCGFDLMSVRRGAGIQGLADRIEAVGGTVELDSAPGQGTTVRGSVAGTDGEARDAVPADGRIAVPAAPNSDPGHQDSDGLRAADGAPSAETRYP